MAIFASDTFTGTDGTALESHTPTVGGAWVAHPDFTAATQIQSNKADAFADSSIYYNAGTPASADYSVAVDIAMGNTTVNGNYGVGARINTVAGFAGYTFTVTNGKVWVFKFPAATALGTVTVTTTNVNDTWRLTIEVSGSSTTHVNAYVQRASDSQWLTAAGGWQVSQVACISADDSSSPTTAANKSALWLSADGGMTGDNFSADDVASSGRTTKNTRAYPLGTRAGMGFGIGGGA